MTLPNRTHSSTAYRYGYQGSEKDDEIKGEGNDYMTHYRHLDPRVGRWMSRDPKVTAFETPYSSMSNNPILYNDKLGDTIRYYNKADGKLIEQINDKNPMQRVEINADMYYKYKNAIIDLTNDQVKDLETLNKKLTEDIIFATAYNDFLQTVSTLAKTDMYSIIEEPEWLQNARDKMGVSEKNNCNSIIDYHKVNRQYKPSGCKNIAGAWCASFVGYNLDEAGYSAQKDPSAQSYSKVNTRYRSGYKKDGIIATADSYSNPIWGKTVSKPALGVIGVMKNGSQWHVGFIVGISKDGNSLYLLGGNQGDEVNITDFPKSYFKAYIVPVEYTIPISSYDLPVMSGSKNNKKIQ